MKSRRHRNRNWIGTLAALLVICGSGFAADPLPRVDERPAVGTFPETIAGFEKATGWKVVFAKGTEEFLRSFWDERRFARQHFPDSPATVPLFTEIMGSGFGLITKPDAATHTVEVDFPWKNTDSRSAAELLKFCMEDNRNSDPGSDPQWLNAFGALISKEENFAKAAPLRQRELLTGFFPFSKQEKPLKMKLLMRVPIQSVSGERFLAIFFNQPILFYPGHGSMSYYWFKEDGTLMGVGMMNTGHRSDLMNASVNHRVHDGKEEATEVHLVLRFNLGDPYMARLVLEDSGLRLIQLFDSFGDTKKNDYGIGESLLDPEKK